jgi:type I restriction enzyme S subunit
MTSAKYARYQDSGVEWLKQVPEHWTLRRLGYYFEERRVKVSDVDFAALSVTKNGIVPQLETAAKTDDGDNRKRVAVGDFVINSRSDRKGSSGVSELDGSVSLINTVLIPRDEVHRRFVHHLFRSAVFQEEYYRFGRGIVADLWSTNYAEMRNILLAVPPIDEQVAIADYLDSETVKIDALVDEQQRLINLLKEKRQAVISQAVTKGLNPNVLMKDSRAGWIGQVPQHWRVSALGYVARIDSGSTPDRANLNYWGGSIPWVKTGEVNYDPITQAEECITEAGLQGSSAKVALPGTLLMAMYGQGVTRGRVAVLEVPAAYNQACAAIRFHTAVAPSFGRYFFMAAYAHVRDGGNETSQMNLSTGAIQKFKITVPPLPEQLAIVDFLDRSLQEIELLIEHADESLLLLSERRSALICAAVTGKIDVRCLVPQPEAVAA